MIYLLHFEREIGDPDNPRGRAGHYIGYCDRDRLQERLAEHRAGRGAAITVYLAENGIGFEMVRVWTGGRDLEKRLKSRKNAPLLCPICSPDTWHTRAMGYGPSWVPGIAVTFEAIETPAKVRADACPF